MIITIDGASGVGKSTIAKAVSEELGYYYISTGRIYRTLAYLVIQNKDLTSSGVKKCIEDFKLRFLDNTLIANEIIDEHILKNEEIALLSAKIGSVPLFKQQISSCIIQAIGTNNAVIEGRKAGSILYPNADLKIFLSADIDQRIQRKQQDSLQNITRQEIQMRDSLVKPVEAEKAYKLDTSKLSKVMVIDRILEVFRTIQH